MVNSLFVMPENKEKVRTDPDVCAKDKFSNIRHNSISYIKAVKEAFPKAQHLTFLADEKKEKTREQKYISTISCKNN